MRLGEPDAAVRVCGADLLSRSDRSSSWLSNRNVRCGLKVLPRPIIGGLKSTSKAARMDADSIGASTGENGDAHSGSVDAHTFQMMPKAPSCISDPCAAAEGSSGGAAFDGKRRRFEPLVDKDDLAAHRHRVCELSLSMLHQGGIAELPAGEKLPDDHGYHELGSLAYAVVTVAAGTARSLRRRPSSMHPSGSMWLTSS